MASKRALSERDGQLFPDARGKRRQTNAISNGEEQDSPAEGGDFVEDTSAREKSFTRLDDLSDGEPEEAQIDSSRRRGEGLSRALRGPPGRPGNLSSKTGQAALQDLFRKKGDGETRSSRKRRRQAPVLGEEPTPKRPKKADSKTSKKPQGVAKSLTSSLRKKKSAAVAKGKSAAAAKGRSAAAAKNKPVAGRQPKPRLSEQFIGRKKPVGREVYNVAHQDYEEGEIQFHRIARARRITWLTEYTSDPEVGYILFSSPTFEYGGPFAFLSSQTPCKFINPAMEGITMIFNSIEHFRQWVRARTMQLKFVPDRVINFTSTTLKLSSKGLVDRVMAPDLDFTDSQIVRLVDSFTDPQQRHGDWVKLWQKACEIGMQGCLPSALRAKYELYPDLKDELMMTGNYKLYEANTRPGGIGHDAHDALLHRSSWDKVPNSNLLGRLTMELRDQFRKEEPEWPTTFAFEYFRASEEAHPCKNEVRIQYNDDAAAALKEKKRILRDRWLAEGDTRLAERRRINRQRAEEHATERERVRVANELEVAKLRQVQDALEDLNLET